MWLSTPVPCETGVDCDPRLALPSKHVPLSTLLPRHACGVRLRASLRDCSSHGLLSATIPLPALLTAMVVIELCVEVYQDVLVVGTMVLVVVPCGRWQGTAASCGIHNRFLSSC